MADGQLGNYNANSVGEIGFALGSQSSTAELIRRVGIRQHYQCIAIMDHQYPYG